MCLLNQGQTPKPGILGSSWSGHNLRFKIFPLLPSRTEETHPPIYGRSSPTCLVAPLRFKNPFYSFGSSPLGLSSLPRQCIFLSVALGNAPWFDLFFCLTIQFPYPNSRWYTTDKVYLREPPPAPNSWWMGNPTVITPD